MALPVLNPGIANLSPDSAIYDLYTRYYNNMVAANDASVETPNIDPLPAEIEASGELTQAYYARVETAMADYNEILMKNAAYNSAVAVFSSLGHGGGGGGGGGSTSGFVARAGDSMLGLLQAKYGFEAGYNNVKIFDTTIVDNTNTAHVYGNLIVDSDANVTGKITVGNGGIYFGAAQALYKDNNNKIVLAGTNLKLAGAIEATGNITRGNVVIGSSGITNNGNVYYHAGNANNQNVDWAADDMEVFGDLTVHGANSFGGALSALNGFELGADNTVLFRSETAEDNGVITDKWLNLKSRIVLDGGTGLCYNGYSILKAYRDSGNEYRVDIGAPGMNLYLGAQDGNTQTSRVILSSDIWNYDNTFRIVSRYGDGNFPNSFSAGCATSGPTVMQTYYGGVGNFGVVMSGMLRFDNDSGPYLSIGSNAREMAMSIPYLHVVDEQSATTHLAAVAKWIDTSSVFADQSRPWSATLSFDLNGVNAEFFRFAKPVEAGFFSITPDENGIPSKTKLGNNILFFDDGVFLEGVVGGIFHSGNSTFSGNLSSTAFSSGFAGSGWAIKTDQLYGGYEATFDSLVVRKKMRVYELEVQKISATNGSLWVSDACSGDSVTEIV